eukprot:10532087-Alexandrium_andersonii.AAC.1
MQTVCRGTAALRAEMWSVSSRTFFTDSACSGPVLLAPRWAQPRNDAATSPDSAVAPLRSAT